MILNIQMSDKTLPCLLPQRSASGKYLVRRIVDDDFVIASLHPTLGPLFWRRECYPDSDEPDFYGISDRLNDAWVPAFPHSVHSQLADYHHRIMRDFFIYSDSFLEDDELTEDTYSSHALYYAGKAGVTVREFVQWVKDTAWVAYPVGRQVTFLSSTDGGEYGVQSDWTFQPHGALVVDEESISVSGYDFYDGDRTDSFVPVESAWADMPPLPPPAFTNYALEAHVERALHSVLICPFGSHRHELAKIHAGHAGRISAVIDARMLVSAHVAPYPELLSAFKMGHALAVHHFEANRWPHRV
jgi:hypothetical protein